MRVRLPTPASRNARRLNSAGPPCLGGPAAAGAGFTTVELVVVLVLLAVLSAVAVPRLAGRTGFESRAFADEVASAVRYAQRTAIAMRRTVTVVTSAQGSATPCALRVCLTGNCSQQVVNPATSQPFCLVAPAATALDAAGATPTGLQFDAAGRPSRAQSYTVSSSAPGVDPRTITVEAETGHVR